MSASRQATTIRSSDVIREQFPLERDVTQDVARLGGIRHPFYPGTDVPTVMTVDFMVTRVRDGRHVQEAFNAKRSEEAEDERSMPGGSGTRFRPC